ncbi:MAG TPA: glycosyltransferase family 2 protein, partial [Bryobacteraceae bacterium]|nr:glycosyltransferase family 2 protein [Bryobacteraceae bacterium]
ATVLLLNPDATVQSGIDDLVREVVQPGVGAAGGRLISDTGEDQHGFNVRSFPTPATLAMEVAGLNRLLPWNPVNTRYRLSVTETSDVEQPAGAFLMVNRLAWQAIGGFDERFHPAWFEDVDFCMRLRHSGYRIRFVPAATATHTGGHSADKLTWHDRQLFWYGNLLRFACKHYTSAGTRVVAGAVMLGAVVRCAIGLAGGNRHAASAYNQVFRQALKYWFNDCGSAT